MKTGGSRLFQKIKWGGQDFFSNENRLNIFFIKNDVFLHITWWGEDFFRVVNDGANTFFAYQMTGQGLFLKKKFDGAETFSEKN